LSEALLNQARRRQRRLLPWLSIFIVVSVFAIAPVPRAASSSVANGVIAVDPSTVYQTMRGWEAVDFAGARTVDVGALGLWPQVADLGINRVRLEVRSGSENPTDSYANWKAAGWPGSGPEADTWRAKRYETINDNSSATSLNASGFHFSEVDDAVARMVTPLRNILNGRGEHLVVNLTYVAFTTQITSGQPYIHNNPAEYAEFMLAAFTHLQQTFGWVPDSIEIILEPENVPQWQSGVLIGQAIVATAAQLGAHGFTPEFIGPSTTCMGNAAAYLTGMLQVGGVPGLLKEVSYHRYCGASESNLQTLVSLAQQNGLATSMLEWWSLGNTVDTLLEDLKVGNNSAWQQGSFAGSGPTDLFNISGSTISLAPTARYTQHYFHRVRLGARRIGATSTDGTFTPVAFTNVDGRTVVVVRATGGGTVTITGLPAGTYGTRYSTPAALNAALPDQTIGAGQAVTVAMPADGTFEVFATSSATPPGAFAKTTPANGSAGQPTSLTLNWNASAGAASYEYCIDTINNGACDAAWSSAGASLSAAVSGLAAGTTYFWQVRANNATASTYADGAASAFTSFVTQVASPGGFGKTSPANGATGQPTSLTLSWNASAGATSYEYCIDTINNGACDTGWASVGSSLAAGVGNLSAGTTYYWQVRSNTTSGLPTYADGSISAYASFSTQVAPPGAFGKIAPANGATAQSASLTVSWSASANATGYEYCIDTVNNSACDAAWISSGLSTSATPGGLTFGTTYYWQARAMNASGLLVYADGSSGAFWNFQTNPGQSAQLTTPAPGSTLTASNVAFAWTGGIGATGYWLSVGSSPGGSDVVDLNVGTSLGVDVELPIDGRALFVRLKSLINGIWQFNDYTLTAARIFSIQKAELTSPAPSSRLTGSTVSFEWTGGAGASSYRLSVGNAASVFDLFDEVVDTNLSQIVSSLPTDGRTVFVRLWTQFDGFWESNDYTFTAATIVVPRKAELTSPAPGSTLTTTTTAFTWTGGTGVAGMRLAIGSAPGGNDLFYRDVSGTLTTVADGLPDDGRRLYVQLLSLIDGAWQSNDYVLTAFTAERKASGAELLSPVPGSTLLASTVKFEWSGGTGVTAYRLSIGSEPGASNLFNRRTSSDLGEVVTGLPADGRALYVRLSSLIGEVWQSTDYVLTAATTVSEPAVLVSPAPQSTLTASTVTFDWTGGSGVRRYWLQIGTSAGGSDLFKLQTSGSLSAVVADLPVDGRPIYVRLSSLTTSGWQAREYTLTAMSLVLNRPAELVSPAPGSTLTSTTAFFRWTGGIGASHYRLIVGSQRGSDDISNANTETVLSVIVPNLPSDGRTIYVRLFSFIDGHWQYRDYTFTTTRGR